MKKIFLLICILGLSTSARAFDLDGLKAADVLRLGEANSLPVAAAEVAPSGDTYATPAEAYRTLKEYFGKGTIPSKEMLEGHYEGRTITPRGAGDYTIKTRVINLEQSKANDNLGPLFESPSSPRMDTWVYFFAPWNTYYKARLTGEGLQFEQEFDTSSAAFSVTFRQYGKYLVMKTSLFGDTYGYFWAAN